MKPRWSFNTSKAIEELEIELNLKERVEDWDILAGYSYTPANPKDIEQYLSHYDLTTDEDKKFVLMEIIIQANVEQEDKERFMNYWRKIKPLLIKDFLIHEFTIHYWKDMTEDNFENCKYLGPLLQKIWKTFNQTTY